MTVPTGSMAAGAWFGSEKDSLSALERSQRRGWGYQTVDDLWGSARCVCRGPGAGPGGGWGEQRGLCPPHTAVSARSHRHSEHPQLPLRLLQSPSPHHNTRPFAGKPCPLARHVVSLAAASEVPVVSSGSGYRFCPAGAPGVLQALDPPATAGGEPRALGGDSSDPSIPKLRWGEETGTKEEEEEEDEGLADHEPLATPLHSLSAGSNPLGLELGSGLCMALHTQLGALHGFVP